jgi:hypothetical protein
LDTQTVKEALTYASYGCAEVLRVLLRLGPHHDERDLLRDIIYKADIKCIKVALYAKLAVGTVGSADRLLESGTIELYALARELGYQPKKSLKVNHPDRYAILEELLAEYKREGCPPMPGWHLMRVPKPDLLKNVINARLAEAKKAKESEGSVPMDVQA